MKPRLCLTISTMAFPGRRSRDPRTFRRPRRVIVQGSEPGFATTSRLFALPVILFSAAVAGAAHPQVLDDRLELTLFAEQPRIVTPVGCTFDHQGRLLVIESHTHFPPEDYSGPKTDRIRIVTDTDGDGSADQFRTFLDGTHATMSIAAGSDRWIYIATRMKIFRVRDDDGDGSADSREDLIQLQTEGNYPHNGLGGLAFDGQGHLYFGLGENLGLPYAIRGRDNHTLNGGGEGGNIYRCRLDGSQLERIATGFWNPFGICVDPVGRVFAVGNDPDASPPCRLVHVVMCGDYGYQFRFGRSGRHPLQAWNGELPGTLPMVAGTGEAPCAVLPYHGRLWVSSWGDYRIERFSLQPAGASFRAEREIVVQGDNHFRPVDFALAPDGSLYFTDWVERSYPVHGKGRIWRLQWKGKPPTAAFPQLSESEVRADTIATQVDTVALDSPDPFIHTAAVAGLVQDQVEQFAELEELETPRQRLGLLEAAHWRDVQEPLRTKLLTAALRDADTNVQLYAVRWIAEQQLTDFRPALNQSVRSNTSSLSLFKATIAAIEWLDQGDTKNAKRADYLARVLDQPDEYDLAIVAGALRAIPPDHAGLTVDKLNHFVSSANVRVERAAVRTLALIEKPDRYELLNSIARDETRDGEVRADAVVGLARDVERNRDLLSKLKDAKVASVRHEATRALGENVVAAATAKPAASDTDAWLELLLAKEGDPERGWRRFFGPGDARCANCHVFEERGAAIGPDLTQVANRLDRRRLIESILQPSREVAPRYVTTIIETEDGRAYKGLSLGADSDGKTEQFVGTDGQLFVLDIDTIDYRGLSTQSVMPSDLHTILSLDELRDLLAMFDRVGT